MVYSFNRFSWNLQRIIIVQYDGTFPYQFFNSLRNNILHTLLQPMHLLLKRLSFVKLSDFIMEHIKIECPAKEIYIRCTVSVPEHNTEKHLTNVEILSRSLKLVDNENQLCNGYNKSSGQWFTVNTTRNFLCSVKWSQIFNALGDEYSIFVLTQCDIIERCNGNFIFVCGHFCDLFEKNEHFPQVERKRLFIGKGVLSPIMIQDFLEYLFKDIDVLIHVKEHISGCVQVSISKYNRIPLKSVYKSFFCAIKTENQKSVRKAKDLHNIQKKYGKTKGFPRSPVFGDDYMLSSVYNTENSGNTNTFSCSFRTENEWQRDNEYKGLNTFQSTLSTTNNIIKRSKKAGGDLFDEFDSTVESGELSDKAEVLCSQIFENFGKRRESLMQSFTEDEERLGLHETMPYNVQDGRVCPDKIIDFLFLISKKFLDSILKFEDYKIWKGKLTLLIKRNVYESLSLDELKRFFKIDKLKIFAIKPRWHHGNKKRIILERMLLYLVNQIYIPIISFFFYSTPRSNSKYKIYYFNRTVWNKNVNIFCTEYLKDFEPTHVKSRAGTLRCIPKTNAFRVIVNCSKGVYLNSKNGDSTKSNRGSGTGVSINAYLAKILPILHNVGAVNLHRSLLGHADISRNLYSYLAKARGRQYILKLDLNKCFDNIPHKELLAVINRLFDEDNYYYSEYKILQENFITGQLKVNFLKKSFDLIYPINTIGSLFNIFKETNVVKMGINDGYSGTFSLQQSHTELASTLPVYKRISKHKLIEQAFFGFSNKHIIKEHRHRIFHRTEICDILENFIKKTAVLHQGTYYRFKKGIPQGCCLSSMLCNLYFGALDEKYFNNIFKQGTMCRYVDDFLIITPCLDEIVEFLEMASKLKDKGLIFNGSKIENNLCDEDLARVAGVKGMNSSSKGCLSFDGCPDKVEILEDLKFKSNFINWCGIKLYDDGVKLKCNMKDTYFRYAVALPVESSGKNMFYKIAKAFAIKVSPLFINRLNQKLGECIFDTFFFIGRRIRILFLRANFINLKYVNFILQWCVAQMKQVLSERHIYFDREKVDVIAKKAFERSNSICFKRRQWK